jgi:hypothetical protein
MKCSGSDPGFQGPIMKYCIYRYRLTLCTHTFYNKNRYGTGIRQNQESSGSNQEKNSEKSAHAYNIGNKKSRIPLPNQEKLAQYPNKIYSDISDNGIYLVYNKLYI